jgi:hypothetical protein
MTENRFEECRGYKHILVMGPHRAGTRITARAMAADLEMEFYDELDIGCSNIRETFDVFDECDNAVLQCPAHSSYCLQIVERYKSKRPIDGLLIVFCMRNVDDIVASQERIKWKDQSERGKYERKFGDFIAKHPELQDAPIAAIQYAVWEELQKPQVPHWFEFHYETLQGHPLWVDKQLRKRFKPLQTWVGQRCYEKRRLTKSDREKQDRV